MLEFPGVFVASYHIHSWYIHSDCSYFLHQFFGYIGGVTAKWILFLNLVLPALLKYATGSWTLGFSFKLSSASLFNEVLHISAFPSLGVYFFLLTGNPYPTVSLRTLFQSFLTSRRAQIPSLSLCRSMITCAAAGSAEPPPCQWTSPCSCPTHSDWQDSPNHI